MWRRRMRFKMKLECVPARARERESCGVGEGSTNIPKRLSCLFSRSWMMVVRYFSLARLEVALN